MYLSRQAILLFSIFICMKQAPAQDLKGETLENQQWCLVSNSRSSGIGAGTIWTFLPDHRFEAKDWYSGGAYWTNVFTGTYHYDPKTTTVYLTYKETKQKIKMPKSCIRLIPNEHDTTTFRPVLYDQWKKVRGGYKPVGEPIYIKNSSSAEQSALFPAFQYDFEIKLIDNNEKLN